MKLKSLAAPILGLLAAFPLKADEFTFGVVPQFEARQLHAIWRPVLEVLEQKTGHHFEMLGVESIPEFEKAFEQGSYDFAYMNPWHALVAFETQGYRPLVKDGVEQLTGILVVRRDSGIRDVKQLEGKQVAFPSPNALGASLLMRAELKKLHGVSVEPIYVGTHPSVYLNVVLNQAAAGGGVHRSLESQSAEIRDPLDVIYETKPIAPHPISAHPRVPSAVAAQVRQAILEMQNDPAQQALLAKIPMLAPVPTDIEDYKPLKAMGLENFYDKH